MALYSATGSLAFAAQPDIAPSVASYMVAASAPGYTTRVTATLRAVPN
ncbi:hypothetical protein [Massilia psychrophila]|nr:hypothetical protein [Massilia psychrophila]GGE70438.1 hypothetical protein GCM10008020_13720 [Massilia psychrophila]